MKFLLITFALMSLFVQNNLITENSNNTYDSVKLYFNSLGCVYCAVLIENEFDEYSDISEFSFDGKRATVSFYISSEYDLTLKSIEEKVLKAQFKLVNASVIRSNGSVEFFDSKLTSDLGWSTEVISSSEYTSLSERLRDKEGIIHVALVGNNKLSVIYDRNVWESASLFASE